MDVYLKLRRKTMIFQQKNILISDVCETESTPCVASLKLCKLGNKDRQFGLSIVDVVRCIKSTYPDAKIYSVGEIDCLIDYHAQKKPIKPLLELLKLCVVSALIFIGAATAIMTFHNDAQLAEVFIRYNELLTGQRIDDPRLLQIPYSIGIGLGIVVFFNHFGSKKLSKEPTPIEIEIIKYDEEVTATLLAKDE